MKPKCQSSGKAGTQEVGSTQANGSAAAASAQEFHATYNALVGHGFQKADIEAAMEALGHPSLEAALDWLCVQVPPDRLPHRFSGSGPILHELFLLRTVGPRIA